MNSLNLLETGTLVEFKVLDVQILPGVDDAEFGVRIDPGLADDEDEAEDVVEWGAFGFLYVLGALSFADARPRGLSEAEYREDDEFGLENLLGCLQFRGGSLYFHADYLRGRRMKTTITLRSNGTATLTTLGRGQAAPRWLNKLKGKTPLCAVDPPPGRRRALR